MRHEGHVLVSRVASTSRGARAPFALWPGAGLGHARGVLLRAHPLLDDGVIAGDVFGRRVYHAGSEWRRWFKPGLRIVPIAPAVFVDVARAEKRLRPGAAWHADAGAGIRIAVPGSGVAPTRCREGPSRWRDSVFDRLDEIGLAARDSGLGTRDSGLGPGLGTRDSGLGAGARGGWGSWSLLTAY